MPAVMLPTSSLPTMHEPTDCPAPDTVMPVPETDTPEPPALDASDAASTAEPPAVDASASTAETEAVDASAGSPGFAPASGSTAKRRLVTGLAVLAVLIAGVLVARHPTPQFARFSPAGRTLATVGSTAIFIQLWSVGAG